MRRRDQMSASRFLRRGGLSVEQMTDRCLGALLLYRTALYRSEVDERFSAFAGFYGHDLMVMLADLSGGAPFRLTLPFGRGRYLHIHTSHPLRLQEPHRPFRRIVQQRTGGSGGGMPRFIQLLPSEQMDMQAMVDSSELGHLRATAVGRAFRPLLTLMDEAGSADGWPLCVVTLHMLGYFVRNLMQVGFDAADDLRSPDGRRLGALVMAVWFGDPDSSALEVVSGRPGRPQLVT